MPRDVVIGWQLSSFFGWGVYGINLALQWAADPDLRPASMHSVDARRVQVDPLAALALRPVAEASNRLAGELASRSGPVVLEGPALLSLNATLAPAKVGGGATVTGRPSIGVTFAESAVLAPDAVERARGYELIVAGCRWNEAVLRDHGLTQVTTILQGVDPALFHLAPARGLLPDRFLVFSGGKLERRKGQDLVVAAFRAFAGRHPEALLVTAWHSPWPRLAAGLDAGGHTAPMVFNADGRFDVVGWAAANGIAPGQVLDLGAVPNAAMPSLLREMDVAVFPNRCEGGTNLVAMEAMACGVPVILSCNTGHLDLIEGEANAYPLTRQRPLDGRHAGWAESDVEEIVEALEAAYQDREAARRRGLAGAETLKALTWARTAGELKAAILAACG